MVDGFAVEKKLQWSFFNAERKSVSPMGRTSGNGSKVSPKRPHSAAARASPLLRADA
jgi:hypothetical protein